MIRNCTVVLFGRRIHHGEVGVGLIVLGLLAVIDDLRDRRLWFRRDRWRDHLTDLPRA